MKAADRINYSVGSEEELLRKNQLANDEWARQLKERFEKDEHRRTIDDLLMVGTTMKGK